MRPLMICFSISVTVCECKWLVKVAGTGILCRSLILEAKVVKRSENCKMIQSKSMTSTLLEWVEGMLLGV